MQKVPEVQAAKLLMNEAINWSVMQWLREKKRVRATADGANATLDRIRRSIAEQWKDEIKTAYGTLANGNGAKKTSPKVNGAPSRLPRRSSRLMTKHDARG
jgi:hypothetical protein